MLHEKSMINLSGESTKINFGSPSFGPNFFTTPCKWSLGQGNIFRSVCQEFCPQGGLLLRGGACSRGCLLQGWVPALGQCLLQVGSAPGGWGCGDPPHDGYCWGWYTSYWNAFLFSCSFQENLAEQWVGAPPLLIGALFNLYPLLKENWYSNT